MINDLQAKLRLPGSFMGALGGRCASPRELDEELQAGRIPQDSFIRAHESKARENQGLSSILAKSETVIDGFIGAATASLVAGSLAGGHPWGFGLIAGGALLGALWGHKRAQQTEGGQVQLDIDGQTTTKKFVGSHPSMFEKTPQELRSYLLATQRIGENMPLPANVPNGDIGKATEDKWLTSAAALVQLGQQRRLVGDLQQKTNYDRPALNLVDAPQALQLLEGGRSVYAVEVMGQKDIPHNFTLKGANGAGTSTRLEDYRWTERQVQYHLVRLQDPQDLSQVQATAGLPQGLIGVVESANSFSERIFQDDKIGGQRADRDINAGFTSHETTWHS